MARVDADRLLRYEIGDGGECRSDGLNTTA